MFLGILLWEAADPEAAALLARAAELALEIGLNRIAAVSEALQARVLHEAGKLELALEHAERARVSLERFGAELADRIVIAGTLALVRRSLGEGARADEIEKSLRKRVAGEGAQIRSPLVRLRQARAAERLLEAVLSPEGPVYPRVRLEGPAAEA